MSTLREEAERRATLYLGSDHIRDDYGSGIDGVVFSTSRRSAIKVHAAQRKYEQELRVYRRLSERDATETCGHTIPRLIGYNDEHRVIEMSVVSPPYVLDFVAATLDAPPGFSPEAIEQWQREELPERFGPRWTDVLRIYEDLIRRFGVYHNDLSANNVRFADQDQAGEMIQDYER